MINTTSEAFQELERGVHTALETYSNVHRGSGHFSMVTTYLYEQARDIVLEYLRLNKSNYSVIFCTPRRAELLSVQLDPGSFQIISSDNIGMSIGVRALVVKRNALPKGVPLQSGGGTTKLISKEWVIWADAPDKFEAGTPAIINVIAFVKALQLQQQYGKDILLNILTETSTVDNILYYDELEKYSGRELLDTLRKTFIGRGVLVPTMEGLKPFINLDNSASTPTFTPIWNAFRLALRQSKQVQQEIIQEVRSVCAGMLGAPLSEYDVIFTSNTTEAINLVAESLSHEPTGDIESVVLNTLLEHSSNDLPWRMVPGYSLIRLTMDAEGFVDLNELETLLSSYNEKEQYGKKRIRLVAINGASNVLGVCNKLKEISNIVHRFGVQLLVDAAQMVAHRRINMEECGIDYLAFSAHKVYAPFGSGAMVVRKGLLHFNSQEMEMIKSSGEENAGGIAALGKSLVILQRIGMDLITKEEMALTSQVLRGMSEIPGLKIYGIKNPESPEFANKIGVIVFTLKGMVTIRLAKELAMQGGIGVRFGCHCTHILVKHILKVGPGLQKFQRVIQTVFPKMRFPGVLRVSIGMENSKEDVDKLIEILSNSALKKSTSKSKKTPVLSKSEIKKQIKEFIKNAASSVYFEQ